MNFIDAVYFINLDHRTDRLQEFQDEIKKLEVADEKVHRISAVFTPEIGVLGCAYSHIKALDAFLQSSHKSCLIFEDDFQFTLDLHYCKFLLKNLFDTNQEFDLVMMGGKILKQDSTDSPFLSRVIDGQTTSAYLITREFAPTLRANLVEGANLLEKWFGLHNEKKHEYCLDIYWKLLQPGSKWFVFNPKFGVQRESYSDIEKKMTKYGV
jgi:hypothetical protein